MRFGIPNILAIAGYFLFGCFSVFGTILVINKFHIESVGTIIGFIIFLLMCYVFFGLLSYRLKIMLMTDEKVFIIIPFRFQFKKFRFDDIETIDWNIWEIRRIADYRKLTIKTNSGFKTNISDFEFINYDRLEKWILDRVTINKLNLSIKKNVELAQAKANRWINLFYILLLGFFSGVILINGRKDKTTLIIVTAIILLILRLTFVLIKYQKIANPFDTKRKKRLQKLSNK